MRPRVPLLVFQTVRDEKPFWDAKKMGELENPLAIMLTFLGIRGLLCEKSKEKYSLLGC